ncbi:Killer toxin subunits alpha/beta [Daldinia childiae]|uniref:Killer toxin subunits alpha/beta n=1 Tax=Daldinia childiae TaxID=326645 RepID=UPI001444CE55|nr:Killer toxin subunits alpha/beta [Daldinia childiae]KAF3055152.1 Killer toxin subunits alpha/beta [Daldinia childiae]
MQERSLLWCGYCGYGPKYCGNGCSSNCDAHAECGQYSEPPNQECPLNACCSQFGFCGTTKDFCNDKCQSNCVEHPKPPGVGGPRMTLSKVIGYWEAWNDRSTCHPGKATDLPIDALTHVNYAFAYLDPQSFKITTMDAATPVSTFQDLADLKLLNPNLEIFVSIGGWTFSDNGTATQPVFGNIAQSATNRQTFANNVLQFLDSFGYDGVDIDWEYPGAPDRGGSKDDGANYVLMLEALRKTFDGSGRKLGITFTAPSSFWYLRWFDLPGMMKHANWVNLMSYDLHGIWDNSNPIGSIVQGHTNLTDIKLAVELFWRVNIPPSRISFGFGFYGRGFTLADPSCKTPGCPFSGGANPGPCTGTSGYLAYYEIQDILKNKKRDITPVYDKEAAVKYLAWNTNQWISYDDEETFKDKIEWADSIGFGGSLIWASDLDDYELTAHKALTGKKDIGTALSLAQTQKPFAAEIDASFGSNCYKEKNEFKQMCDIQMSKWLLQTAYTGRLPDGNTMKAATLTASNIAAGWNKPYDVPLNKLVEVVTDQKDWFPPDCPSQRFGVINGDYGYRYSLLYVAAQLNAIKGRIFRNVNPLSEAKLKQLLDTAIAGGSDAGSAIKTIIEVLQMTFGVFEYINDSSIASTIDRTRADQRREIQNMENHISELRGIAAVWDEFEPAYYAMVSARATRFVLFTTSYITLRLGQTYVNSDLARLAWTAAQLSYKIDRLVVQTGSIG